MPDPDKTLINISLDFSGDLIGSKFAKDFDEQLGELEKMAAAASRHIGSDLADSISRLSDEFEKVSAKYNAIGDITDRMVDIKTQLDVAGDIIRFKDILDPATKLLGVTSLFSKEYKEALKTIESVRNNIHSILNDQMKMNRIGDRSRAAILELKRNTDDIYRNHHGIAAKLSLIGKQLQQMQLGKIGMVVTNISNLAFWIGAVSTATKQYLEDLSLWTTRNFAVYGSTEQIARAMRNVTIAAGTTQKSAVDVGKALMEVAMPQELIDELHGTLARFNDEIRVSPQATADLVRQLHRFGAEASVIERIVWGMAVAQDDFNLTVDDTEKAMRLLERNMDVLRHKMHGDSEALEEFSRSFVMLAGAAKTAGGRTQDMDTFFGLMDRIIQRPLDAAPLLAGAFEDMSDDMQEALKNPAIFFNELMSGSEGIINILRDSPIAMQEISRGLTSNVEEQTLLMDMMQAVLKLQEEGYEVTRDRVAEAMIHSRREQDLLWQLTRTWDTYKAVVLNTLEPVLKLLNDIARNTLSWLNGLGETEKRLVVIGTTIAAMAAAWASLGGSIIKVWAVFKPLLAGLTQVVAVGKILMKIFAGIAAVLGFKVVIIAAVAAGLAYLAYRAGVFGRIRDTVVEVWTALKTFLQPAINDISEAFTEWWNYASEILSLLWDRLVDIASWISSSPVGTFLSKVGSWLVEAADLAIWGTLALAGAAIWGMVKAISLVVTYGVKLIRYVFEPLKTILGEDVSAFDRLVAVMQLLFPSIRMIIDASSWLIDKFTSMEWILWGNSLIPALETLSSVLEIVKAVILTLMKPLDLAFGAFDTLKTGVGAAVDGFRSALSVISDVSEGIKDRFTDMVSSTRDRLKDLGSNVVDTFKDVSGKVRGFAGDVASRAVDFFSGGSDPFDADKADQLFSNLSTMFGAFRRRFAGLDVDAMALQMEYLNRFVLQYRSLVDQLGRFDQRGIDVARQLRQAFEAMPSEAIVTVKNDVEDRQAANKNQQLLVNIADKLDTLISIARGVNDGESTKKIKDLLSTYLPELVDGGQQSSLGATSSSWNGR